MSNRIIPSFIQELLEHGISMELTKDSFIIVGFYKSGTVEVKCAGESDWFAHARYNEITPIDDLQDIVGLHYKWWQSSKERWEGWSQPESQWVDLLLQFDYIEKEVIPAQTVYK